jgi:hypothetical protein
LGCYGSFEFAYKLEGGLSYLVLAAPLIAATAALIPPIAEMIWRGGHTLKALLWWAVLLPAGAVGFFSAAERVHTAKAGAEAERSALRSAASRAEVTLTRAEAELVKARAAANKARAQVQCGPDCRTKLATEATAQADVEAARLALLQSERKATSESPLKAPVWLLPAALDAVAFMAIWTGLAGRSSKAPGREARGDLGGGRLGVGNEDGRLRRGGDLRRITAMSFPSVPPKETSRARRAGGLSTSFGLMFQDTGKSRGCLTSDIQSGSSLAVGT